MKLRSKLAIYNTVSKVIILIVFVILMPYLIRHIAVSNTDRQLLAKRDQVLTLVKNEGINSFIEEGSADAYGSYNLLKEEFISLEQIDTTQHFESIEDSPRMVEGEVVDYRVLSYTFDDHDIFYVLEVGRSLSTIQEIEGTLRRFALITLLIIYAITILTDIAFTKHILRPLDLIISKLRSTKDPAAYQYKPVSTTTTDFQYLDNSINEMMVRIQDIFVKERHFISNVSHELLTPVSIMQGKLENLLSDPSLSEDAQIRLVGTQKTLSRLKNIIRALLLISKIENHQYLKNDTVSVTDLLDEVIDEIEDRLMTKEIVLKREGVQNYTIKNCNLSLLHTLLFNLINNATKYNHVGGCITLSGVKSKTGYLLRLTDSGIGIALEDIPLIFNRFKRLHKNDNESFGLGLPIVKTIADFHGIDLDVNSAPDEGTTFSLHFKDTHVFA